MDIKLGQETLSLPAETKASILVRTSGDILTVVDVTNDSDNATNILSGASGGNPSLTGGSTVGKREIRGEVDYNHNSSGCRCKGHGVADGGDDGSTGGVNSYPPFGSGILGLTYFTSTAASYGSIYAGAKSVLTSSPPLTAEGDRPDIYTFSPAERIDLYTQMSNYITMTIIAEHCSILAGDQKHGTARFLPWHRNYIKHMEDYLVSQGRGQFVPLPKWNPSTCIPDEFFVGGGVDPDCVLVFDFPPCTNCSALENQCPGIFRPANLSVDLCGQTNFNSFRPTLEGWHNGVHGAVGGTMNAYKSPSAPIFWLWHAFVDDIWFDWQCKCGLDENGAFDAYTADEKNVDLVAGIADTWIKDSDEDIANEPNNETGAVLWQSKDIWVRNTRATRTPPVVGYRFTNEHQHENPEYDAIVKPWIYVKLRNRGCQPISGDLHVYWANASTGLTWPGDFHEVATSPVNFQNVSAGRDHVAEYHWTDIPMPGGGAGSHFCLLARFVADPPADDPINGEQANVNISGNVKNSNQIAWKNLTIVDTNPFSAQVLVRNIGLGDPVRLTFTVPDEQTKDSFFDHGTLIVDLAELFPIWIQGGAIGSGIKRTPKGFLQILGPDASIDNLRIDPGTEYLINLTFSDTNPPCECDLTAFSVLLNMLEGETLLGGNTYQVLPSVVLPCPQVIVVPKDPPINCQQGPINLISVVSPPEDVVARQWFVDGIPISGADGEVYTADATGVYSVLVTFSNGCDRLSPSVPIHIGSPPRNDDACNATRIALGIPQDYDIFCATAQPGEVTPGAGSGPLGGCDSQDGWCGVRRRDSEFGVVHIHRTADRGRVDPNRPARSCQRSVGGVADHQLLQFRDVHACRGQ